jgi:hypothetical protein
MTLVAEPARPSAVSGAAADGCIVMEVLEVPKLPISRLSILAIVLSDAGAGGQGVPPAGP